MKNKLLLLYIFIFLGPLISSATCPGDTASFTTTPGVCDNKIITFTNTSLGATTYFWDFGDGTTLGDTSHSANPPAYTYPVSGIYTATLIVEKGTGCADTFTAFVNMSFIDAAFTQNAPRCISDSVNFTDASIIGPGSTITVWKWDFGDTGSGSNNTSNLQNPSHLFSAGNQTFFVKLVTTSSAGCKDSLSVGVGIQSLVVTNAGTDVTSCDNNLTVNLSGSILNAGGGSWTGTGGFSNPSSLTPIYTPTDAAKANGSDTVMLTSFSSPYCPNVTDTVVIFFNPGPNINAGPDVSVCKDTSGVPVAAIITGATGGTWYTLGSGGTFANATDISTIYFPSSSDTAAGSVIIYMESTGNGICLATRDSLTITFTALPTVLIKSDDNICSGNSIILSVATSTGDGTWSSSGTGLFLPNTGINALTYLPNAADELAGIVTLYFISGNNAGCQPAFDTLDVTIKPSPNADFTSISACEKDAPVVFTNTSTSAGTIVSQLWTFGDVSVSFQVSPTHTYTNCGSKNVSLSVTANNGCSDSNIQSVDVYCLPVANFSAAGICLNDGTDFTNSSTVSGASISTSNWDFGDNTTSIVPNPSHSFPAGGSFLVTLIVQSSQGCMDTLTQTVSLVGNPVAVFTVNDATADISQNIIFSDQTAASVAWSWNFGDGSSGSGLKNPNHTYTVGGFYNVCLIATDGNGCTDTTCQQEIVSTYPVGPTAFSPNGDGQNDVFYAYGGPFKTIAFRIYNNWGELIFESERQWAGWDGKYKGVDQAIGVYVYTIVGVTEDDTEYSVSGDVTLLR